MSPEPDTERRRSSSCVNQGATPGTASHHRTDSGNAERLIDAYGDRLRYCPAWGSWLVWDGRRWARDDILVVEHLVGRALRTIYREAAEEPNADRREALVKWAFRSESAARRRAAVECARSDPRIVVRPDDLDRDPWLFNCLNGTIDLRSGQLRAHLREDLITRATPVEFDPDARLELWDRVLDEATDGDEEMQEFLARLAGVSLSGVTVERLPFVYGPTSTMKSTFLEALKATWGDYAQTADFETFLKRNNAGSPRTDLARLAGARLVISIETDAGARLADDVVKMVTGGDRLVARRLYQNEFEFTPQFTLWWAANDAPRMSDRDSALWRRIVEVPFIHQIPEGKRNPQVKATLTNPALAGPAILAWAFRGCLAWQREGLGVPPVVRQATEELREEMNPLRDFFADRCAFEPDAFTPSKLLWDAYGNWSKVSNERHRLTRREFGLRIRERLECKSVHCRDGDGWPGIRLADEAVQERIAEEQP
jgi:putative DNA primase/helicase